MNGYAVHSQHFGKFIVVTMEDKRHRAVAQLAPQLGNNLFSFTVEDNPVIIEPPELIMLHHEPYLYGIPILFPPNRVSQARFTFHGRTYQLPKNQQGHHMHGELAKKPWRVVETGTSETIGAFVRSEFRLSDHPEIMAYFPHELIFTITYFLKNGKLQLTGEVLNLGTSAAPYAIGFHPYFHLPSASIETDAVQILIASQKQWPVNSDGFIEENPTDTELCGLLCEGARISKFPERGYSFFSLTQTKNRSEITDKRRATKIVFETDEHFPFMVVFRPTWVQAISLEPYTCVPDCFNLRGSPERAGARAIEAGHAFRFQWNLQMNRI